ncbi:uncharacterized protein FOMMEDRAFT_24880 [Fomitiporia mediterranea MF3/22]|uniref:uncharacterized protein n=1 Tax=Fomitiporia mediterranea (strain MF3/22) TaxID=694068 RepID=UPI0004407EFC|nr:uncharacterized protein FOMMEDRAFT_24880 [Fomitiporia mediterranea MF3/22]EJD07531.1 hypothetical protein FOMMEDRAFT_24880 [Fomitiporia mediterranea MF3/22]
MSISPKNTANVNSDEMQPGIDKWHDIKERITRLDSTFTDTIKYYEKKKQKWQGHYNWFKDEFGSIAKQNPRLTVEEVKGQMDDWKASEFEALLGDLAVQEQKYHCAPQTGTSRESTGSKRRRIAGG